MTALISVGINELKVGCEDGGTKLTKMFLPPCLMPISYVYLNNLCLKKKPVTPLDLNRPPPPPRFDVSVARYIL